MDKDTTGAPIDWSGAAKGAYQAYAAVTDNKNFRGEEMPAFEALPVQIQKAWEAATAYAFSGGYREGYEDGKDKRPPGYYPPGDAPR